jgi:hypothetical protein
MPKKKSHTRPEPKSKGARAAARPSKSEKRAGKSASGARSRQALPASAGATAQRYSSSFYQVQPGYIDPNESLSATPFFLPPTSLKNGNIYGQQILVLVNNVYGSKAPTGCTLPSGIKTDFTLAWGTDSFGKPQVQVTTPAYAWNVSASDRQNLKSSFAGLCQGLEALEANQCLARGGAFDVAQRVVEAMPMPISEVLYYKYGFDQPNACIDIQPGMQIRIESQGYEQLGNTSPLTGFVETAVANYSISTRLDNNGAQVLAFDAFLGAARPSNLLSPPSPAGGIIDLQGATTARRYFRLFYPTSFASSSTGNTSLANNVALIGANSLADLAAATSQYLKNGGCAFNGTNSVFCLLFRGRAIVIPEIQVFLGLPPQAFTSAGNNVSIYRPVIVPIGTTLRNLVQGQLNWTFTPTVTNTTLSVIRQYHQFNTNAPPPGPPNYTTVQLNPIAAPTPGPDVFDLPLVKGDAIAFTSFSN